MAIPRINSFSNVLLGKPILEVKKMKLKSDVEEVPLKWMDRPSATEMERGRASEMDRWKSYFKKKHKEMPLK